MLNVVLAFFGLVGFALPVLELLGAHFQSPRSSRRGLPRHVQGVADVCQMLQELTIGVCEVGYGDEWLCRWVGKQLQGGLD